MENLASRSVKSHLLPVRDVAAMLRVRAATVYSLCERGQLAYARVGACIRIEPGDVDCFLQSKRQGSHRQ
jgi:excisionase family DNA binding protein